MNKGKLIVSSKEGKSPVGFIVPLVFGALLFAFGCFMLSAAGDMHEFLEKSKRNYTMIAGFIFFICGLMTAVMGVKTQMSYCEVYENALVGKTSGKSQQNIELPLSKIDSVAVEKALVVVVSGGQTYKFLAGKKKDEIANAIRARVAG